MSLFDRSKSMKNATKISPMNNFFKPIDKFVYQFLMHSCLAFGCSQSQKSIFQQKVAVLNNQLDKSMKVVVNKVSDKAWA